MAEWQTAVSSGNAVMLSELVCASAPSPDQALALVRGCVEVLEKKVASAAPATSSVETRMPSVVAKPATPASLASTAAPVTPALNGYAETAVANNDQPLCTLEGVQLLQPRGRFNLEFRKLGILITGKAGSVNAAWDNVRHIIRLPRPEGFNWGKLLDPNDPAGSDLLALPLKEPVPFRKTHASIVVVQPDPKVKHAEVSITLDGVSHKVSGSQGTIMSEVLKLLSRVRECKPDRGLFFTRESKSFVKCYHGVNEGSLFPLKQGLLFMKPALFLPRGNISEVVCGRGGSATTRYVDLVVGVEASAAGRGRRRATHGRVFQHREEALPGLQQYIQNALVAPREREARKASAATAKKPLPASSSPSSLAAPAQSTAPASTVAAEADQSQVTAAPLSAASTTATATATSTQAVAPRKSTRTVPSSQNGGGSSTLAGAGDGKTAMVVNGGASPVSKKEGEEEEEEDDGDAESDEDYGPPGSDESDGDYSGSDVSSAHDGDDSGSDDDDSDDNSDAGEEGLEGDEVDGAGGSDGKVDKNKKREDEGQGDEVDDAGGSNGDEDKVDRKRKRSSGGDGGKVNRDSKVAAEKAGGRDGGEPERGTEEKGFANIGGGGGKGGNEDEDTESDGEERRRKK